jgi:hypothetical protein
VERVIEKRWRARWSSLSWALCLPRAIHRPGAVAVFMWGQEYSWQGCHAGEKRYGLQALI